jgi:hypothetical protein
MKTVSEYAEQAARARWTAALAAIEAHKHEVRYLEEIEAQDIPVFQRNDGVRDRTNYTSCRENLRASVREGTRPSLFLDVACDRCKTALRRDESPMVLASDPPKITAWCIGCGCVYYLPTSLERYALPPLK